MQEKKAVYRNESADFLQRLKQFMAIKFREAETDVADTIERSRSGLSKTTSKLDLGRREKSRRALWPYSPLLLFAREVDTFEWEDLMRMYEATAKKPYQEEFRDNIFAWKRIAKKVSPEEQDVLFTTQEKEKEAEGIVVRKLTVKRSKTIRADGSARTPSGDKPRDGDINAYEAFAGALYDMTQSVFVEQNFVVDLFHVSSLEGAEFPDAVAMNPPESRRGNSLAEKKLFDPDRTLARRLVNIMDDIYSLWPTELQNLADWVTKQDSL